jgi:hypothetical protein
VAWLAFDRDSGDIVLKIGGSGLLGIRFARLGKRRRKMLETIAIVLVVLWLLGFVSSYTMGGFIHVLLVIAVVVILIRVIQGRRL